MIAVSATTNAPYVNRVKLSLIGIVGPLKQNGSLGNFDPRRDIELYVDGVKTGIRNFTFDVINNAYLMYTDEQFNLQGVIQVVHHMPSPIFYSSDSPPVPITGFALIAAYSAT